MNGIADMNWAVDGVQENIPSARITGKHFDHGNQFGIIIYIHPQGVQYPKLRNAVKFNLFNTIYDFFQVFPAKYERAHQRADCILDAAGIGWWISDEDCLEPIERAAWDKACQIINTLPEDCRERKRITESEPKFFSKEDRRVLVCEVTEFLTNWIKEVAPRYLA